MKRYHKRSFMVPIKFILIVQNNSEIFKSISYRYKFLVGARDPKDKRMLINPFWTVAVAFFLAETGDKTQLATIAMAARFGEWLPLLIGTTVGMIAADGLGVLAGTVINRYVSQKRIQMFSAIFFLVCGFTELVVVFHVFDNF